MLGDLDLGGQVGDDAVDFRLDLAVDVRQLVLGGLQVRMQRAVAALQVGHAGADGGALLAQLADGGRAQGGAHVLAVRTALQLALSGVQAPLGLGLGGAGGGQLLVQLGDFLFGQLGAVGVRTDQVMGGLVLLDGGVGGFHLLPHLIDLAVEQAVVGVGLADLLLDLVLDVGVGEGVGDSGRLGRAVVGIGHRQQQGLAHALDLQRVDHPVDDGVALHLGAEGALLGPEGEVGILVQLQGGDHLLDDGRGLDGLDLGVHRLVSGQIALGGGGGGRIDVALARRIEHGRHGGVTRLGGEGVGDVRRQNHRHHDQHKGNVLPIAGQQAG